MFDFAAFIQRVGAAFRAAPSAESALLTQVRPLLAEPADPQAVISFLYECAKARASGDFSLGTSQVHPNGFTKISIYRDNALGWQARVHIWWGPSADVAIHDHRWSFASRVLGGHLAIENFVVTDDHPAATPMWCYRLSDAAASGEKTVTDGGRVRLAASSAYQVSSGATHFLTWSEPHLVRGLDPRVSATLIVTAPASRDFSDAYHPRPRANLERPAPRELSVAESNDDLSRLCEALAGAGG